MILWLVTGLLIRATLFTQEALGLPKLVLAAVPILFMYAPVALCKYKGVDPDRYPIAIPSFRDWGPWRDALVLNAVVIAIVFPLWFAVYHGWQTLLLGNHLGGGGWPEENVLMLIGYHLFFVAIPEEFFYRGYVQSRLDEAFPPGVRVLGARVGLGLILASAIFALGHTLVDAQWWQPAIFIPALAFGWMRARTGDVMAGAFFHAWCNVTVYLLDSFYGGASAVLPT